MSLLDAPPAPHHFTPEHVQFRAALCGRVAREIAPQADAWDEAETFPRDLYKKAAAIGREVKVMMIGGGSAETMKDLAARQLGI